MIRMGREFRCELASALAERFGIFAQTIYTGANYVEYVLRSTMEWPNHARRRTNANSTSGACCGQQWSGRAQHANGRTSPPVPANERHRTFFFTGVDLCVCARYTIIRRFYSRMFKSSNDGGKLERLGPLGGWRLHMSER